MGTNGELRTEPAPPAQAEFCPAIGGLTSELQRVVEQLEADWRQHRSICRDTAAEIHALRVRAERLLSSSS